MEKQRREEEWISTLGFKSIHQPNPYPFSSIIHYQGYSYLMFSLPASHV
jgi:hypothetical protein